MADTKNWTWVLERTCPECGFDASALERTDIAPATRAMAERFTELLAGGDEVRRRPGPEVWSALEYGCHVRDVFTVMGRRLHLMLSEDDPTFANWDQDATATEDRYDEQDPADVSEALRAAGLALADAYQSVADDQWAPGRIPLRRLGLHRRVTGPLHGPRPRSPRLGRRAGLRGVGGARPLRRGRAQGSVVARRGRLAGTVALGLGAAGYLGLQRLGRGWGATRAERRGPLAGDSLVPDPHGQTTHAVTIAAPPAEVWPWLVQIGYHRGGWYTYPWVDHYLFHMSNPSADEIVPELQELAVGDRIPDGEPDTAWYDVVELEPDRHLVLHSTTHLPVQWRQNPELGAWVDWSWVFALRPVGADGTRLILRARGSCGPWWIRAVWVGVIIPADFVMARSMLRGIRERAERAHAAELPRAEPVSGR